MYDLRVPGSIAGVEKKCALYGQAVQRAKVSFI